MMQGGISTNASVGTFDKWLKVAAASCFILGIIVLLLRCHAVLEIARNAPGTVETSGCEEDSFLAVSRAIHGVSPYHDTSRIPYSAAYFNWMFYEGYSLALAPAVAARGDAILPLAGRIFTLVLSVLGAISAGFLFIKVAASQEPGFRLAIAVLGVCVFVGPLVGWWAVTLRPDVGALFFEVAGIGCLLLGYRQRPWLASTVACLLFYLAWALKPTIILGLVASVMFLLVRRRWRLAAWSMVLSTALWLCTAWLLGPAYRQSLLDTATTNLFVVGVGRQNLVGALAKLAPFALAVPAFWRLLHEPRRWLHDSSLAGDALLLGTAGSVVAFVLSFLASCKLGASDNYFFTAGLLLALAAVAAMALLRARGLVLVACVVFTAIQAGILFGVFGALNQSARISEMSRRWQAWRGEAEPRFSSDMRLNLPWLNPASPPFVLAFNYPIERARGRIFEAGGLGGLIEQGYFASLLLPPGCTDQFDGGRLARYARTGKIGGLSLYRRNPRLP